MKINSEIFRSTFFLVTFCIGLGILYFFESIRLQEVSRIQQKNAGQEEKTEKVDDDKVTTETESVDEPPKLKSLSPYDIQDYVDGNKDVSLENVWKELDISNRYYGEYFDENSKNGFLNYCNYCKAELFKFNLDEDRKTELILRLSDGFIKWRYIVFKHMDSDKWKAIGLVDFTFGRYREPQHYFLASKGKNYLVINHQTGSGTGFSQYFDSVFAITNGKFEELLRYPAEGHESGANIDPTTEFTGNLKNIEITSGKAKIEVEFNVKYDVYENESESNFLLFQKRYKVVYTKYLTNEKLQQKVTDGKRRLKLNGKDTIREVLSNEKFAEYNLPTLTNIIRKKGTREYRWLKTYLSYSSDSPQERHLLKLMKN